MSLRVGVLVSGRGSNLQALLDAIGRGEIDAQVAVVVSNHAGVPALGRAAAAGVPTFAAEREAYPTRRTQQLAMAEALEQHDVGLVVLAGFDRVLHPEFVARFSGRIINVHPSLLPAFGGGLHAQADALAHGVKIAGCTVHFVTDEVDAGPIILQAAVPVLDDDTAETLAARILREEHRLLPAAVDLFARGLLQIQGRRVIRKLPAVSHSPSVPSAAPGPNPLAPFPEGKGEEAHPSPTAVGEGAGGEARPSGRGGDDAPQAGGVGGVPQHPPFQGEGWGRLMPKERLSCAH